MAISLTHTTVAVGTDAGNGEIRKAQWNEAHTLTSATGVVLGRTTAGTGVVEEVAPGSGITLAGGFISANAGVANRAINGGMVVDQRNSGASQTFTAGAALAYAVDRFYGYCTGANVTGQRIALSNGQNRYRFTGAASVTGVGLGQRIEAANCLDLAGVSATLQVKASSSSLTTLGWAIYYASTTDAFGTLAVPTRTLISSGNFTISSTEATYSASVSVPSAAITGLEIVFTGGALLATQTLTLGDVQLERGTVATAFERRPIGFETALCQRYYSINGVWSGGTGATTTTVSVAGSYPVQMRVAPTPTLISGTNAVIDIFTAARTVSAISASVLSVASGRVDLTVSATTSNRSHLLEAGAISFSAEL